MTDPIREEVDQGLAVMVGTLVIDLGRIAGTAVVSRLCRELPDLRPMMDLAGFERLMNAAIAQAQIEIGRDLLQALTTFVNFTAEKDQQALVAPPPPTPEKDRH